MGWSKKRLQYELPLIRRWRCGARVVEEPGLRPPDSQVACDCDMPSSAPRPPREALLTPSRIYAFCRMRCAGQGRGQRERTHLA